MEAEHHLHFTQSEVLSQSDVPERVHQIRIYSFEHYSDSDYGSVDFLFQRNSHCFSVVIDICNEY